MDMNTEKAYSIWAEYYDTNKNKTRDIEAISLRETLSNMRFKSYLEIGCGTGKNTEWLINKVDEYFDNNDRTTLPRILTLLLQR
jgi:hypothetical protein